MNTVHNFKVLSYEQIAQIVDNTITSDNSGVMINYAKSFANGNDNVVAILAEQIEQAANSASTDTYDMSVFEYVALSLDEAGDNLKAADHFETSEEAEEAGFYWIDETEKWLKLDFTK